MQFILLAFSNQQDSYLDFLKQEERNLRKILLNLRGKVDYEIISSATTDEVFEAMAAFHDQVTVFHYGGHANSLHLELENRQQGVEQFIQLLKGMKKLQIVFLNGCSTHGMVNKIMEALDNKIAIIATASKIDDQRASDFAKAFYTAFSQDNQTLEGAFEMAKSILSPEAISSTTFRGLLPQPNQDLPGGMPWGVYGSVEFTKKVQLLAPTAEPTEDSLIGFKATLKKYLTEGEVDQALTLATQKFAYDNDTLVNLLSRWNRHKKDVNNGTLTSEFKSIQENQINLAIQNWVNDLDDEDWK